MISWLGLVVYDIHPYYIQREYIERQAIAISIWSVTIDLYRNIYVYIFEVGNYCIVNNFTDLENKPLGYYKHSTVERTVKWNIDYNVFTKYLIDN